MIDPGLQIWTKSKRTAVFSWVRLLYQVWLWRTWVFLFSRPK